MLLRTELVHDNCLFCARVQGMMTVFRIAGVTIEFAFWCVPEAFFNLVAILCVNGTAANECSEALRRPIMKEEVRQREGGEIRRPKSVSMPPLPFSIE